MEVVSSRRWCYDMNGLRVGQIVDTGRGSGASGFGARWWTCSDGERKMKWLLMEFQQAVEKEMCVGC